MEYLRRLTVALLLHVLANNPGFIALPITLPFCVALVVLLLALRYGDLGFHEMAFPVKRRTDTGLTLLSDRLIELGELFFVQE